MTRRLPILLLLIVFALSLPASAGALPTPRPAATEAPVTQEAQPVIPEAPSYGVFKGEEDALISQMPDGTLSYLYTSVGRDAYEAFGEVLEADYRILEDTIRYEDYAVSFDMTDAAGEVSFSLSYDGEKGRLIMLYPAGTVVEKMPVINPFSDMLEVVLGQKLSTSYGTVSIDEIHLMDGTVFRIAYTKGRTYIQSGYQGTRADENYPCWLGGQVENQQKDSLTYSKILSSCTLHYVNQKADYDYGKVDIYGGFSDLTNPKVTKELTNGYGGAYYATPEKNYRLSSLSSSLYACALSNDIPDAVIRSADGILAVTFTVDEVAYVLYLRK